MDNKQIIRYAEVKNINDPEGIGRIRALPTQTEINNLYRVPNELLNDSGTDVKSDYWWTREDPFVYLPLLPFFTSFAPKPKEFVHIIFANLDYPLQNKFYIPHLLSTPTAVVQQNYNDSLTFLSDGTNNKTHAKIITELQTPSGTTKTNSYGIFPIPEDIGFLGRGTTDLILKENSVLLRAGKSTIIENDKIPVANNSRAFLELDFFPSQITKGQKEKKIVQTKNVALVKYLVEYQIYNPENNYNLFMGEISLFKLKPNSATNTDNLNPLSNINQYKPPALYSIPFKDRSISEVINLVNQFVNSVSNGIINIEGYPYFRLNDQFPFYFRMSTKNYKQLNSESTDKDTRDHLQVLFDEVNPFENSKSKGKTSFGLVAVKGQIGNTFSYKIEEYQNKNFSDKPITYGLLGGDELFFMSHKAEIPGKPKITIDKSIYGYTQEQISTIIKEGTEGMVRGEQLLNLLNMIVSFLVGHVHGVPGTPPNPVSIDQGSNTPELKKLINEAPTKILNEYIRIN